jgi:hypothetical protein
MKFLILTFFLILIVHNLGAHAQDLDSEIQNSEKHITNTSLDSKIHPTLKKWQTSEDPEKFAQQNNLLFKDNTIRVYIYLTSEDLKSILESEVDPVSSYQNIVVSFVTSEQLDKLSNMDIVEKITPPELARVPPIPTPSPSQSQISEVPEKTLDDYLVWIILSGIVICVIFIYKHKRSTNRKLSSI